MPEKPTPQFFKEAKKRCPQCGGALPCSTHSGELKQETEEEVEMNFIHSETLYEAQQNERIGTITVAPDGTHWSAIIEGENKIRANCINGVVEDWHDKVSPMKFSPSGHHMYVARDVYPSMETRNIYKDGKKVDIEENALWPAYILNDGRIVARTEKKEDGALKHYLYVEDETTTHSDYVIQELSVSGNHYAFVLTKTLPNGETAREFIYDGTPKIQADAIDQVVLEDNGKTLAYVAYNHSKTAENTEQQEATIYVNDETYEQVTLGPHDKIEDLWVSKTGKRAAYVVSRDAFDNQIVSTYIDHREAPYTVREIAFSPNEENILGIAVDDTGDERRDILLLNGKEIIKEEKIWFCGFLDDETWYALCEEGDDNEWMVINHTEEEHFASVHEPQQSPDKKHIAYIAENYKDDATSYYVVINQETKPLPFDQVDEIVFSDDGKSLHVFGIKDNMVVKKTFSLNTKEHNQEITLPAQKQY